MNEKFVQMLRDSERIVFSEEPVFRQKAVSRILEASRAFIRHSSSLAYRRRRFYLIRFLCAIQKSFMIFIGQR